MLNSNQMLINLTIYLSIYLCLLLPSKSTFLCDNDCNQHGICTNSSTGGCECFPGFIGYDCSLRICPSGFAWYDFPSSSMLAHADYTECSNMVRLIDKLM